MAKEIPQYMERCAAELDPKLAMAYWGIAESVGPNYNDPASEDRFVKAHAAIAKAETPASAIVFSAASLP